MKSNVSVLRGLKHEDVTDFGGRDRLLSSLIIYEFLIAILESEKTLGTRLSRMPLQR